MHTIRYIVLFYELKVEADAQTIFDDFNLLDGKINTLNIHFVSSVRIKMEAGGRGGDGGSECSRKKSIL